MEFGSGRTWAREALLTSRPAAKRGFGRNWRAPEEIRTPDPQIRRLELNIDSVQLFCKPSAKQAIADRWVGSAVANQASPQTDQNGPPPPPKKGVRDRSTAPAPEPDPRNLADAYFVL